MDEKHCMLKGILRDMESAAITFSGGRHVGGKHE
jgi:hypothetical protein